ncbi:hypothetical protein KCP77_24840 (plasmid) [Salmonella enterica subsp. enterica]|nr:hypothetical protein KCP77_24840 [Salmonella enterica subsp. enterica]
MGEFPTQHRRPQQADSLPRHRCLGKWADFHTAPAPGKVGGFTTHRRPARCGLISRRAPAPGKVGGFHTAPARGKVGRFHTAPAPGKVGGFPHSTGARCGGPISYIDMYVACVIRDCAAQLVVWRSVPRKLPRAAANVRSTAPVGTCAAAAWR